MKKTAIQYGIISIPKGTVLCTMEKGGDKDNKAVWRFSDTGKRTSKPSCALITNETMMKDLYGEEWAHTKQGWVKAEDLVTWYGSYKEATEALGKKKTWRRTLIRIAPVILIAAAVAYVLYRRFKSTAPVAVPDTAGTDAIQATAQNPITDEIPLD